MIFDRITHTSCLSLGEYTMEADGSLEAPSLLRVSESSVYRAISLLTPRHRPATVAHPITASALAQEVFLWLEWALEPS
jgi:hypothetical protein